MKKSAWFFAVMTLCAALPAQGQVARCTMAVAPIPDDRLESALQALKRDQPSIALSANAPCRNARDTISAFNATFHRRYFKDIRDYRFSKIVDGKAYFTVEVFQFGDTKALSTLATALETRKSRILAIEAFTSYDYFVEGDHLVLMLSSAMHRRHNAVLFAQIKRHFTTGQDTPR